MFNLDFSGKIVLVTGASRGIGKGIAQAFEQLGAKVYGTATSEKGAAGITEYLNGHGKGLVMNSLDKQTVEDCFNSVVADAGSCPDIIVNNAGITRDTLFMRMKEQDWEDVLQCNLFACVQMCKLAIGPMMKKRAGRIINISSIVGQDGNAGQCNYAAAKAGLIGFSKSLAKEVGSRGITVNCIAPGFVATDMTAALNEEQLKAWTNSIPLKRAATVEDIAGAAVFLASDLAAYITGSTIDVNGGLHCN
ncbi:3-oxoacyl-[acyl-carrier-protein] reductase [uncultured Succinivibrio sp.]|uniref:3-oxoacyl-[acyl-carrier-protein] reductase n=1 Tax=uncultured Succinivibrio sp. TaxID=540749 RepID=UPI0025E68386|nr:3-oxoacyl-[acyl-carrier-protein] reductase [uncultured Succinivibrio sp.]